MMVRRVLYLHGFASSPDSRKGKAFDVFLTKRGFTVERLDLRVPNRNELRVSAMIEVVERALTEPAVIIGSSLGGLVAAQVVARRPEVPRCMLMAPAFDFGKRWEQRLGAEAMARWRAGEPVVVPDHGGGPPLEVDYGFYADALDVGGALPLLSVPALVFHGLKDDVVPIDTSRRFDRYNAKSTLVEVDDDHALTHSLPLMLPATLQFLEP